jgi:tRNA modification GTPase
MRAMLARRSDPIVAIASAPGRGAVGVVRLSGRDLAPLVQALVGHALVPRRATYTAFLDARGLALDRGLAIHFPAPHSYTGEDVLELQAHGGPVVLQLIVARCLEAGAVLGLRLAEPGEFTERAFLNDKLDLAQAEAVADLIDASTEAGARGAARALEGEFSREVGVLRDGLIELRSLVEATLDFPEEEIDFLQSADALGRLARLADALEALARRARQGALLREGLTVVIAGAPNVGKSSLLNALAGAERAIVTPIAGTTRDRIEETIQVEGVPLHVIDTAGLREAHEAADAVERIGIERSWQAIEAADVVLVLHDLQRLGRGSTPRDAAYVAADEALLARLRAHLGARVPLLQVFNKADLVGGAAPAEAPPAGEPAALHLSARTGEGLDTLRARLLALAGWQSLPEGTFIARARHVEALGRCGTHLARARALADQGDAALELLAEELRAAHDALAAITGAFSSDDLLGVIFSRFCMGK